MGKYWNYMKYVLEHKKNVFKECWKEGMYLHAFTHDLSKFSPKEFFAYANYNFQNKENNSKKDEDKFQQAWEHHYYKNKHHWKYWNINWKDWFELEEPHPMPLKYIKQMICDWNAMSIKFGGTSRQFYKDNKHKMKLNRKTKQELNVLLENLDKDMQYKPEDILNDIADRLNISSSELKMGGYLQSVGRIWITYEGEDKESFYTDTTFPYEVADIIDFVMEKRCLGGDIIINNIRLKGKDGEYYNDEQLTNKYKGHWLNINDWNGSIW